MKKGELQIIYGHTPFNHPVKHLAEYYASVWIVGCNGDCKFLTKFSCDDHPSRGTDWKNGALTRARKFAEAEGKFYGITPKRLECGKEVPRSLNYSVILNKYNIRPFTANT